MATAARVRTTSTTVGTGNYVFSGTPFADWLDPGERCYIMAVDLLAGAWESGIGTLQPDGSLAREIEESSNEDNSPIAWGPGIRRIIATFGTTAGDASVPVGDQNPGFATPPVVLTDAPTITLDSRDSKVFRLTLAGNRLLANPSNLQPGASFQIFIRQDNVGNRTLDYGTAWNFPNKIEPVLSTEPNALDILSAVYDGISLAAVISKGFGR